MDISQIIILAICAVVVVGGIALLIKRSKDRKAEKNAPGPGRRR